MGSPRFLDTGRIALAATESWNCHHPNELESPESAPRAINSPVQNKKHCFGLARGEFWVEEQIREIRFHSGDGSSRCTWPLAR
jgi:hypothetical protein